jgi:glycosyltransferase involved in cell wall biosynthesis
MRLIQVVHGWPPEQLGGTGLYVDALSRALQQAGHEVKIVAPGPPGLGGCSSVQTADLSGWVLTQRPALSWAGGWRRSGGLRTWRRLLSSFRPDVVHVHHLSGLPLGLVRATQAVGIPVALTLHDYWIPCHRGQLMTPDLSRCTGPSPLGCARCTTGQSSPGSRSQARAADRIEAARDALEAADRLWSPSEALAQTVASMGLRRPELCPLPLVRAHPELSPAGAGPVRFLFAGSIIPTKAPHLALEAFAGLSGEATLSLAGHAPAYDGSKAYGHEIEALAASTEGARWLGAVSPDRMSQVMAEHDVLVLPSIWPENSPLVVREATASGLRVIGPEDGGTRELCPDARLIAAGDVARLRDAMQAEAAQGRGRSPAQRWQSPQAHADWLLAHYPFRDDARSGD